MTKSAAEELVDASEQRVCMRVEVDGPGRAPRSGRRPPPMERPIEIMGDICFIDELPEGSGDERGTDVPEAEDETLTPNPEIMGRMIVHPPEEAPAPEAKEPD